MQIDFKLLTLIISAQSFVVGGLLLAIASGRRGIGPRALALRGFAMLAQGVGYALISQRDGIGAFWSGPLSFALVGMGHGVTLVALRMLLGLPEYRGLIAALVGAVCIILCLPGWLLPNRAAAAAIGQVYSIAYAIAIAWPLVPRMRAVGSIGQNILLGTAVFMALTQAWWLLGAWLPMNGSTATMVLLLTALMPTLTGVAFLMMCNGAELNAASGSRPVRG
jgi:hypothetical protein